MKIKSQKKNYNKNKNKASNKKLTKRTYKTTYNYLNAQFEKYKYSTNLPPCVLYMYKTIKVELECAIIQLQLLKDMKKYLSVLVDINKNIQVDYQIEKQAAYLEILERRSKLIYYKIDEICYSKLYEIDKAVFKEIILDDLSPKEAQEGNLKKFHLTQREIIIRAVRMYEILSKCNIA